MGWVRIDDNAPHHRKMLQAGPHACWLWVCGLAYCQRMRTDGFIPTEALPMLGVGAWKKYAGILVSSQLWHKVEGGYQVHDFLDWNASADERAEQEQANRDKVLRYRHRKRAERNTVSAGDGHHPVTGNSLVTDTALPSTPLQLHSTPKEETPPPPPPLIKKRKPWNFHEGERIEVPQRWHEDHVRKLGLPDAEAKLLAWYAELDAQLVRSRRPVGNWFKWLDACYEPWANDLAVSDELEAARPKGA